MNKKIYNMIDFYAATFYYRDLKLHKLCDQADISFFSKVEGINFHQAWKTCSDKKYYRQAARAYIDSNKEISRLKSSEWASYEEKDGRDA